MTEQLISSTGEAAAGHHPDELSPSKELLCDVADLLGIKGSSRAVLYRELHHVGSKFQFDRWYQSGADTPKRARAGLEAYIRAAGDAELVHFAAPEYIVAIDGIADRLREVVPPGMSAANVLRRRATAIFLDEYRPKKGRPTDLPLERAVRALTPLLERLVGPLRFSLNKNKPQGPELCSVGAKALGVFLVGLDPALTITAIVNMIVKIRHQPDESECHLLAIMRADPAADLDCSLLPGSAAAIEAIYHAAL